MKILMVYHRPGYKVGHKIIDIYRSRIEQALNIKIKTLTLESFASGKFKVNRKDLVFALLIFEGNHYKDVKRVSEAKGLRFIGKIPNFVTTQVLERISRCFNCEKALALYHSPQELDVEFIDNLGFIDVMNTSKITYSRVEQYDCYISLSLLPSRSFDLIYGNLNRRRVRYLLPFMYDLLILYLRNFL